MPIWLGHVYVSAFFLAASPFDILRVSFLSMEFTASDIAAESCGGTARPPSPTVSGRPLTPEYTRGLPWDMTSSAARPKDSKRDGMTNSLQESIRSAFSSSETYPRISTLDPSPFLSIRLLNFSSSGPLPQSINLQSMSSMASIR